VPLSLYELKPRFQQLLRPFLRRLASAGVTPNQVTVAAMALSVAYGGALAWAPAHTGLWLGLPLFLLLRMALNALDGMLATATASQSPLGAVLNELCDQVSDVALYLPFALAAGVSAPLAVLAVIAALLAEFAGVLAPSISVPRRFDGPMGKSDRAFCYGVLALLIGFGASAAWCNGVLAVVGVLACVTVFNRLRRALRLCVPATR
jgi:CDP-diacylglycerol--glycerol-3-phosphate 3-phosphatidyltransferase